MNSILSLRPGLVQRVLDHFLNLEVCDVFRTNCIGRFFITRRPRTTSRGVVTTPYGFFTL